MPPIPAATLAAVDPAQCLPALALDDDFATWTAERDLLASDAFDTQFVIETGIDGRPSFRFGDGVNGLGPALGTALTPSGRFGRGTAGNIGSSALAHVVLPVAQHGADLTVTNPLPARGGVDPEPISAIRIAAPQAFRVPERAVTAADYAAAAMRHDEVANAVAVPRWTGAWQTMLVYVDRVGGQDVDDAFRKKLLDYLESYRLMGFDIALRRAIATPLDISLFVCARPDALRITVAARVRDALRAVGGASGQPGFFSPDNFTFGSPLYLSKLIAAVMAVDGVQSVTPLRFQRLGRVAQGEIARGVIHPGDFEVLQLDDDPSFPERGRLALTMGGGR
jgi:predicted phage baseplate assembly protein